MSPEDHAALLATLQHRVAQLQRDATELRQETDALRIQAARSMQSVRCTLAASHRVLTEAKAVMVQYPRIL